ncbi:MAG: YncE family protein [Rhodospirillaceae bacterium]
MKRWMDRTIIFMATAMSLTCWSTASARVLSPCPLDLPALLPIKIEGEIADIRIDDNCRNIYATNRTANRVERFSMVTRSLAQPIAVGRGPMGLDISADGKTLFVANYTEGSISILPLPDGAERARISTTLPRHVAALSNGFVLFTSGQSGFIDSAIKYLVEDPSNYRGWATRQLRIHNDSYMRVTKSVDRRVGMALGPDGSRGPVYRYTVADAQLTEKSTPYFISRIATDSRGAVGLVSFAEGTYLYDMAAPAIDIAGTIYSNRRGFGVALDPFGRFGYRTSSSSSEEPAGIDVISPERFTRVATLPFGGAEVWSHMAQADLEISRDGTLLAMVTENGFTLIRTPASPLPRVLAFSSSHELYSSLLTFHNRDTVADTVYLTIFNYQTGALLGEWESPAIAPGVVAQFRIEDIEREVLPGRALAHYSIAIGSLMKGSFAHLLTRKSDGAIMSFNSCGTGADTSKTHLTNVVGSAAQGRAVSMIAFANTDSAPASVSLGIYDASTGVRLGAYASPPLPPGGGQILSGVDLERGANPAFTPRASYVVKSETQYRGILQHLLRDERAGISVDLSGECPLPAGQ